MFVMMNDKVPREFSSPVTRSKVEKFVLLFAQMPVQFHKLREYNRSLLSPTHALYV